MTITEILSLAEVSEYLSVLSIKKKGTFGGGTPSYLPTLIRQTRQSIEWKYNQDPSDSYLVGNANYLYSLCGRFLNEAKSRTGTGGSVSPVVPVGDSSIYPLYIITPGGGFEADGVTYINMAIGSTDTLALFVNELAQQFLLEGVTTFSRTATGFVINIPDFDANAQSWTIRVEKIAS